uniref:Uncharacterized protein n=1 Tax=Plectus sambesii TaxID=2011161 RepID=A0A914V3J0_9BILA
MVMGNGPEQLASALGDNVTTSTYRQTFIKLLTDFGHIQSYFVAQFLEDEEIEDFSRHCETFAENIKQLLPNESITPKMHFLVSHLPEFARHHKTLGLISEQPLESLNAIMNKLECHFSAIRDGEQHMKLILQQFYIRCMISLK